ncbi:hypothetical protein ACIPW5_33940 [Streptomyces sp. NPDC090077]|uniref:hypothetical protein n=1 Tax=Streptomyces sp. NPDC090077 TaxID=3365938 RepID=UPI0037F4C0E4
MPHTMVVAVPPTDLERLDAFVEAQQSAELRWQACAEQPADVLRLNGPELRAVLRGAPRRAAQARLRAGRQERRESGLHRPTRALVLAPGLRAELEQHGLLREWEPVPADAATSGQTLGGTGPYAGAGLTGRLVVALPEPLWAPLTRGVYWSNRPHVQALQAWTDRWGPGPAAGRSAAPPEALAKRERAAAQAVTTGNVVRAALERALKG